MECLLDLGHLGRGDSKYQNCVPALEKLPSQGGKLPSAIIFPERREDCEVATDSFYK